MAASRLKQLHLVLQKCSVQGPSVLQFYTQTDAIMVTPKVSLLDQPVHIKVHDLPCNTKVTVQLVTQQEWRKMPVEFMSCCQLVTDQKGEIDMSQNSSFGGTYTGVDSMGLFWSLQPSPAGAKNIRMVIRNGDEPAIYKLSVHLGHLSLEDLACRQVELTPVHMVTVERWKKPASVRRIVVREGNIRGMLFLPAGDGPFPGVIDMFGSAGGLMETRACLLASHGFAALALPFFRYEDLPPLLGDVKFDYFEEAAQWLSSHPSVKKTGLGVVAVSTGAEFALVMAWKCPQVKAVVNINGPITFWIHDLYKKDGTLLARATQMDKSFAHQTEIGLEIKDCFQHGPEDIIPVWESSAHVLALVSEDDQQVDPADINELVDRYPLEKRHLISVRRYPGAGHLLEPPYTPHCKACINPTFDMDFVWGGNPKDHAAAQLDSWQTILSFLNTHIS